MDIIFKFLTILCVVVMVSCSGSTKSDVVKDTEVVDNDPKITEVSQLENLKQDLTVPTIAAKYIDVVYYISSDSWEIISDELKNDLIVQGIRVPSNEGDFILSCSDVYLDLSKDNKAKGDFIRVRDDFIDLPTKNESECIVANWNKIQSLLEQAGKNPLVGSYWTKERVHDEYENVLGYGSYYVYGEANGDGKGDGYVNTAQTVNSCHLRLVKRLSTHN